MRVLSRRRQTTPTGAPMYTRVLNPHCGVPWLPTCLLKEDAYRPDGCACSRSKAVDVLNPFQSVCRRPAHFLSSPALRLATRHCRLYCCAAFVLLGSQRFQYQAGHTMVCACRRSGDRFVALCLGKASADQGCAPIAMACKSNALLC